MTPTNGHWTVVLTLDHEMTPPQWVAHCLDLDLVSQGESTSHAIDMIWEAIACVVEDDTIQGFDPLFRCATADFWAHPAGSVVLLAKPPSRKWMEGRA